MKTKEIYFLVAASVLVVAGWAAWRFTASREVVDPQANTSLPAQQTAPPAPKPTPSTSQRTTGKLTAFETAEKFEIAKKHLSEEKIRSEASLAAMRDPKARDKARRVREKPEDMAFLKSLGLSDELRDKVYEMLTSKADLFWDHEEKIKEAALKREFYTPRIHRVSATRSIWRYGEEEGLGCGGTLAGGWR